MSIFHERSEFMQQFIVPQFIDIEPKIMGPITVRQFVIFLVGLGLMFVCYKLFDFALFVFSSVAIFAVFGSFAFIKINGRPLHYFVLNVIQTLKKPSIRVWRKEILPEKVFKTKKEEVKAPPAPPKLLPRRRLSDLSLLVNTGGMYAKEET